MTQSAFRVTLSELPRTVGGWEHTFLHAFTISLKSRRITYRVEVAGSDRATCGDLPRSGLSALACLKLGFEG